MTDPVRALIDYPGETVPASMIAPVVGMHPSVIRYQAKAGTWERCAYVISGSRVKFFKDDFLRRCGFIEEEKAKADTMAQILEELRGIREILTKNE